MKRNNMKKLAVLTLAVLFSLIATAGEPMATMKYVTNQVNRLDGRIDAVPDFTDVTNIVIETAKEEIGALGLADTNFVKTVISNKRDKSDMNVYVSGAAFNISKIDSDYPADSPFVCYPAKVSETPSSYVWLLVDKNGNVKKSSEAYDTQTALMTAKTAIFNYGTNTYTVAATDRVADYPFIYTGNGSGITEFAKVPFGNLATKATTLEGYGITNAVTKAELSAKESKVATGTYVPSIAFIPLYDGSLEGSQLVKGCWLTNVVLNTANGYPQSLTVHLNGTICGRVFDNEEIALTSENPTLNEAKATIEDESGKYYLLYSTELPSDVLARPYKGFVYIYRLNPTAQMTMYSFTECRDLSRVVSEVDTKPYKNHDKSLITSKAVYDATSDKLKLTGGELKGSLTFNNRDLNSLLGWEYPKYTLFGPRYIETGLAKFTGASKDEDAYYFAGMGVCEPDITDTKFKYPAALWVQRLSINDPRIREKWVYDQYGVAYEKMVSSNDIPQTVTDTRLAFPTNSSGVMLGGTLARTEDITTAITNKADKANTLAGYGITDAVPLVEDVNSNNTAVTIGSRKSGEPVGKYSLAYGDEVTASAIYSHAEGYKTTSTNEYSHAEGYETDAFGYASHAEGLFTSATGTVSHAEGQETNADGRGSHAEGKKTTSSGQYSHAEGGDTTASHFYSHAEGSFTTASGASSHAEGSNTTASGAYSHAEGEHTTAAGYYSHAEGGFTTAGKSDIRLGRYAHASGFNSYATNTTAYVWNGSALDMPSTNMTSYGYVSPYGDHGNGTYNINPVGGLYGFWIGDKTLYQHIVDVVAAPGNYAAASNAEMAAFASTEARTVGIEKVEIVNESIPFCLEAVNFTYTSGMFTVNPTNWPNYKSTFIFGTVADGIQFASNIMFSGFVNSNETVVPASATTIPRGSKWYGNIRRIGNNYYIEYIGACE